MAGVGRALSNGGRSSRWAFRPEEEAVEQYVLKNPQRAESGHAGGLGGDRPGCGAQPGRRRPPAAALTATVERPRATNESKQKGPISAASDREPTLPQTQRRLSSKDGTMPTEVAMTLAQPAVVALVATRTPRMVMLMEVEMADTVA